MSSCISSTTYSISIRLPYFMSHSLVPEDEGEQQEGEASDIEQPALESREGYEEDVLSSSGGVERTSEHR